jgi:hypothetical protein
MLYIADGCGEVHQMCVTSKQHGVRGEKTGEDPCVRGCRVRGGVSAVHEKALLSGHMGQTKYLCQSDGL